MGRQIFTYFAFIVLCIVIISCKKTSTNFNVSGNLEYLTQQAWKIISFEQKINSGSYVDQFPSLPACSRDDEYKFATNNTYQLTEGATKCNPSNPDLIYTGFWQFMQNEKQLAIDAKLYGINKLDDTKLILLDTTILAPDTTFSRITLMH